MRGRKPKPTAIKILEGNPGRRPLNEHEPRPSVPTRAPKAPASLGPEGQACWRYIVHMLLEMGVYTNADHAALEMFCASWERWQKAEAVVRKAGAVLKLMDGQIITNPHVYVLNRAWEQLRKMLPEFGLTPSSRTRLKANLKTHRDLSLADLLFADTHVPQEGDAD